MANGHGGARAGAGRKPRAERFASEIQEAEQRVADKLPFVIDKMLELAEGISILNEEGRIYHRPPDYRACQYLIDRILGKPKESIEHSGEIDGPQTQVLFYLPENGRDPAPAPRDPSPAGTSASLPGDAG